MVNVPWWTDKQDTFPGEKARIIKSRVTIEDALSMYAPAVLFRRIGNRIQCPVCGSKDRDMQIWRDHFKCFSGKCEAHGDAIDLVKLLFGLSYGAAVDKLDRDFSLGLSDTPTEEQQAALRAATALREEQESQRREAIENLHRWGDLWITLDRWLRDFPPGDKRHDDAAKDINRVSYYLDCAEIALNRINYIVW